MDAGPIGIFDSGLGGLTVVKEIIKTLPNEDIVYFGDTARVPYGTRSVETIKKFSGQDVRFLLKHNVKCVLIACHTSSAVAGSYLRSKFKNRSILDVVSSTLKALKGSREKIGVIGTQATVASGVYSKLKNCVQKACPLFVPFIEEGETKGELICRLVKKYLKGIKVQKIVLACTHYPIIEDIIQKQVGNNVKLINPGILLARDLRNYLSLKRLLNNQKGQGNREYFVSDLNERFTKVAEMFLGEKLDGKVSKSSIEDI